MVRRIEITTIYFLKINGIIEAKQIIFSLLIKLFKKIKLYYKVWSHESI